MKDIQEYINSYYTSYHYSSDEIIEANNKLIEFLKDTNDSIKREWGQRKKYDIDYADDVKMWEIVMYNSESEEWDCMGIYAEDEGVANTLANMFEFNDKEKGE